MYIVKAKGQNGAAQKGEYAGAERNAQENRSFQDELEFYDNGEIMLCQAPV